jgi:23S rRNA (uracil1939-C5)-methyltransferase
MKEQRARYSPGERFEAVIERIVPGGAGLARGPHGVVLVEEATPGDRAEIEVQSLRGGAAWGRIVSLLHPGPGRTAPPCPFYGRCGGCDFQHLAYEAQFEAKKQIVADAFERIGGMSLPNQVELHPAPRPFGSRARVEFHTDRTTGAMGFFGRRSHTVVDVDHCMVSRVEIDAALQTVRRSRQPLPASIHMLGGEGSVRSVPALPPIEGGPFWLRIGELDYLVDPGSFFQSSLDLLPQLIETVVDSAGANTTLAWDLFAGAGLFSLSLARRFERVQGVDTDPRAIDNAALSAKRNEIHNARFHAGDVLHWLSGRTRGRGRPDLIVVDPPRAGLGRDLAAALAAREPDRLVYVSCDPTTLARDLHTLVSGSLGVVAVSIFDLFPQTHHVETVVLLETRRSS